MSEAAAFAKTLGLPAGAVAFCVWIIHEAKTYEKNASESALKYFSCLLINGNVTNLGPLLARLVPSIFDRVFRPHVIWQFILRSILVTTIWWIVLLMVRNPHPFSWQLGTFYSHHLYNILFILSMYIVDIISLIKARALLKYILIRHNTLMATVWFVVTDVAISYILPFILFIILSFMPMSSLYGTVVSYKIEIAVTEFLSFRSITDYLFHQSQNIHLITVVSPSTLLTSIWTILLLVSCFIAVILIPIEYIRRFTVWWFRDVEKHPLTVIARVASTIILIGLTIGEVCSRLI